MSVPEMIGRYRIVRRIGSGAFATVWLGADEALDAQVAIKVLADNWSYHSDLRTVRAGSADHAPGRFRAAGAGARRR
ncbi:hypothetical protein AB0J74_15640 [Asanoa sp. NPDC049573]|uniref:hypothetical protein n=1 Tax=Asanoa sp. NPDC049573 TaxID=3155396 RepID=UPI00342DB41E